MNESGTINSRNKNGSRFDQLFYGGIVVGLIIVGVSILLAKCEWVGIVDRRLILCSGLGIILGAFGSTAIIKYRGFVIAGVAAIAIALTYVVFIQAGEMEKKVVFGTIRGDFRHIPMLDDIKQTTMRIEGDHVYLGAITEEGKQFEFVVKGKIDDQNVIFTITYRGISGKVIKDDPYLIKSEHINKHIGTRTKFSWKYIKKKDIIEDNEGNEIGKREEYMPGKNYASGFLKSHKAWVLSSPVFAGTQRNLSDIFDDLTSESDKVRRNARSELAAIGPSAVRPLMEEFGKHQDIYRIRLGVLVALNEMLRNKSLAHEIIKNLNDNDRRLLVKCLTDNDLTIRINASLFLFDLGDASVIPMAIESAKKVKNPDYIYLHFVAIDGAYRKLLEQKRKPIRDDLQSILDSHPPSDVEKARKLFDSHFK